MKEKRMVRSPEAPDAYFQDCTLCPRNCHANRLTGKKGRCKAGSLPVVSRAALHFWEEPCISGQEGSGAVFFSGCSLGCIYCQNREISVGEKGKVISPERLSDIFLELQSQGANNINLVTAAHFAPWVVWALQRAEEKGLHIPAVYNSGGYESIETLRMLEESIDVYLPDMKYADPLLAESLSGAVDYPQRALAAIEEMLRQTGPPVFNEKGLLVKGTLVRHMILPGKTRASIEVLRLLHQTFGDRIGISILSQYTPVIHDPLPYKELGRRLTAREYRKVVDAALDMGITRGYYQERDAAGESFIPAFDGRGV